MPEDIAEVEPDDAGELGPDDETDEAPAAVAYPLLGIAAQTFTPMSQADFEALALAQLGKPYVLGAEAQASDANPPKFDCSELTQWLFDRNGTPIGDLAAAQYNKTAKATGNPRVGDLVFLRNNPARANGVGHVAVIVGGSKGVRHIGAGQYEAVGEPVIVEARGHLYGVVRTTLTYWQHRKYYTGLRRFPGFRLAVPVVVTPPPVDVPPATASTADFKVGQVNLELWGGSQTPESYTARGRFLADVMRCSVYLLCETSPALPRFPGDMRTALLAVLDASWKVEAKAELAVAYDGAKWRLGGTPRFVMFGVYQGALCVPLVHIDTGLGVDFVSVHVRPGHVATDVQKRADIRQAFGLAKGWPVVLGGDMNTATFRDMLPPGFTMATPDVQTQAAGGHIDHVAVRSSVTGTLTVRSAVQKDPGAISDHLAWVVKATLSAPIPTN